MASMNFENLEEFKYTEAARDPAKRSGTQETDDLDESQLEPRKCRYNPSVLVGNWYEKRIEYEPPADDWVTVHDSTYTCKKNPDFVKDRKASEEHKTKAKGLDRELLFEHYGRAFHNNYGTTNDIFYRVIPLGLCGPRRRKYSSRKDAWLPEVDLSENFGNTTNFGFSEALTDKTISKRFSKPRGLFNEPMLAHLDIDVDQPFRPHLIRVNK